MSNVIETDLFSALYTMDYMILQRDKAWTKYLHYQLNEPILSQGWLKDWQSCNDAIKKIIEDYPSLGRIHEARNRKEKVRKRERRTDRS